MQTTPLISVIVSLLLPGINLSASLGTPSTPHEQPAKPAVTSTASPTCGKGFTVVAPSSPGGALPAQAGNPASTHLLDKANQRHVKWLKDVDCHPGKNHNTTKTATPSAKYSRNWSGYEAPIQSPNYVQGEWTVPAVQRTGFQDSYSSIWPGLGGDPGVLIQAGTEQSALSTGQENHFWLEVVPNNPTEVVVNSLAVHTGDDVATAVGWANNTAYFVLCNFTLNTCVSGQESNVSAPGNTAEWIVERPTLNGGYADLANFGSVRIWNAGYNLTSQNTVQYSAANGGVPITMMNNLGGTLARVSGLEPNGSAFTGTWVASH